MKRFRDFSISRKLYVIVGAMAVLIAGELFSLWFAINTLSAVRSTVGAEGLYSKAQKDGIFHLAKYQHSRDEEDYKAFQEFMKVPLGDRKARLALSQSPINYDGAAQGFSEGRVHPDDIDGIINLFKRFSSQRYIDQAVRHWTKGDSLISLFFPLAESLHAEIISLNPSTQKIDSIGKLIGPVNSQLTILEDNFSFTLGEGSRWLENTILKLLFIVALTVEISGLLLTFLVSRSMTRGLREIANASKKVARGDLSARATVFSKDEIGQVATAINDMTTQLTNSNKELAQFAYIASHDLQEPLRTITNYTGLLQQQYKGKMDDKADKYLDTVSNAAARMQRLIKDILEYSQIGENKTVAFIDCGKMIGEVLQDMSTVIEENHASIEVGKMPQIYAYPELRSLFQNLVSNAIKFRQPGKQVMIQIDASENEKKWIFSVADNGIGVERAHQERIFTIFQKLHSRKEYSGSGIGLAHCRKIAELHGGKIWIDAEPGKGSTFYFSIPKVINV